MLRSMRKFFAAAAIAGVAIVTSSAAVGLDLGAKAPRFETKDVVNTTSVDVQTLAGRVVLLEIFRTW